jgi:thioredoxin 1
MSKSKFKDIIESSQPVLIDFYADWCGPCKVQTPILKKLKKDIGDIARIIKIDVDKHPKLSQSLDIFSIPTVAIFQNGQMKWRASGVQSAAVLKNKIEELL